MISQLQQLTRRGFSAPVLDTVQTLPGTPLLPLVARAIAETQVLSGGSLLLAAPPATGKHLIAGLAAIQCIQQGRQVLCLVATRTLANERSRAWPQLLEPQGIQVACSTRDRRDDDPAILAGTAPLVVAVYEKAASLLVQDPALWSRLGLLIADDLHLLGDPTRGGIVDTLLTRWRTLPDPRPQLVALSPELSQPKEIADWLGVQILHDTQRPVPLREGILDAETGRFRYRDVATGETGEEQLLEEPLPVDDLGDLLGAARTTAQLLQQPVLVYYPTRSESWHAAQVLARVSSFPPARSALAQLATMEPEVYRERLASVLERGIAFHHAEMSAEHRHLVEQAVQSGEVRIVCATSSLGQGGTLATGAVFHSPLMMAQDPWAGAPALVPIGRERLLAQAGRALRKPLSGLPFGRSVVVARGAAALEKAWNLFMIPKAEILHSPLERHPWSRPLAEITRHGIVDPAPFFESTFAARHLGTGWVASRLCAEVKDGLVGQLWKTDRGGRIRLTPRGEVHAATGISSPTLHEWSRHLSLGAQTSSIPAALFLAAMAEDEWEEMPLRLLPDERRRARWPRALAQRLDPEGLDAIVRQLLADPSGAPRGYHVAARRALILLDGSSGAPIRELEERHTLTREQAAQMARLAASLLGGLADLARALRIPQACVETFESLAQTLPHASRDDKFRVLTIPVANRPSPRGIGAESEGSPATLRLLDRSSGIVEFDGRQVTLTPHQFRMLEALAECPMEGLPYGEIERRVWQGVLVERQLVGQHRRSLEQALLGRPPESPNGELIRTRHAYGLFLNLPPDAVHIPA